MLARTLAHELSRENFVCVALHPGWVRTEMGGRGGPLTPSESVRSLLAVIDRLSSSDTGRFFDYRGKEMPW